MKKKITVVLVTPGKKAEVKQVENTLESLQYEVGGLIQAIYPFEDPVAIICNEEGKLNGLPFSRALYDENEQIYDVIAGTFMVVGVGEENFVGLSEELAEKYKGVYLFPEKIVKTNDGFMAIKYENF